MAVTVSELAGTPVRQPEAPAPAIPSPGGIWQRTRRVSRRTARYLLRKIHYIIVVLLLTALVFFYMFRFIFYVVGPGEAGVEYSLFRGGTITDRVYPEGLHFILPWNRFFLYNVRIQTVFHNFRVLTNQGLPIDLELAIRYRPDYALVAVLHQRVGPDYVNQIVIPTVESVLRRDLGQQNPEDVYTNKEGILTEVILKAIEAAGRKYVYVEDVIIRRVSLPPEVKDAIAAKLVEQQKEQAYQYILAQARQEAQRKRIEAVGLRDYQAIISETLSDQIVRYKGVEATQNLATSANAKVVVIGAGEEGLPVILGNQ